jgi:hypothetical protein
MQLEALINLVEEEISVYFRQFSIETIAVGRYDLDNLDEDYDNYYFDAYDPIGIIDSYCEGYFCNICNTDFDDNPMRHLMQHHRPRVDTLTEKLMREGS